MPTILPTAPEHTTELTERLSADVEYIEAKLDRQLTYREIATLERDLRKELERCTSCNDQTWLLCPGGKSWVACVPCLGMRP